MPRYLLLLHDPGTMPEGIGPQEIQAIIQRYVDWRKKVETAGHAVMGHKLRDGEGRVMKSANGRVSVTDGPYAEAREVVGGLFVVDADSYDQVQALCADCPHLDFGTIEIREIQPT
jgi:hypothetical protein